MTYLIQIGDPTHTITEAETWQEAIAIMWAYRISAWPEYCYCPRLDRDNEPTNAKLVYCRDHLERWMERRLSNVEFMTIDQLVSQWVNRIDNAIINDPPNADGQEAIQIIVVDLGWSVLCEQGKNLKGRPTGRVFYIANDPLGYVKPLRVTPGQLLKAVWTIQKRRDSETLANDPGHKSDYDLAEIVQEVMAD